MNRILCATADQWSNRMTIPHKERLATLCGIAVTVVHKEV
ncbi:hypothetical protein RUMCAL_02013 [Ruminococcus callidus ATCC 27760]|uniref:Uncharacterized protein n=1 Tax=Ruminococcus callidus ATCC 27760 TaxID=411473 RepID=U2LYR2_9FIRM|nr:hypothetical protein RUMCAL_02013 [Ruminococcus callidus ATCC 27760]